MSRSKILIEKSGAILHSVRLRLALWFVLVLAVVLLFFSVFVYARTAQDVRSQTTARLVVRLREMNDRIKRESSGGYESGWWTSSTRGTNPFALYENEVAILSDPEGKLAETWGSLSAQETADITGQVIEPGINNGFGNSTDRLFTYPLIRENENGQETVNYLFAPAQLLYENRLRGWIVLGQPVDPEEQLPRLFWTLFLAGSLTLIIALIGAFWLADRSLWPVKVITRTAREISETDLSRRLNIQSRDELGELASTFDRMLERLQTAFDRQRQFTADASHELRTPLTIIGLETERILEGKRTAEDYRGALEVVRSENAFMSHLVNELLTLARIDAGQVSLDRQALDLSDVALEVAERFENLAAHKGVHLEIGDLLELPVSGDRQYLAQMIGNLIDNAIKYSDMEKEGQWVRLETGAGPAPGSSVAWVRVSDNGPGIAVDHLPHLFDRFYRIDRARSHNPELNSQDDIIPGSGLGLSIVQRIAQMHGGQVIVKSQPGRGSVFEIRLPGAVLGARGPVSGSKP